MDERKNNYDLISNDLQTIKNIGSSMVAELQDIRLKRHLLRVFQVAEAENYGRFSRKQGVKNFGPYVAFDSRLLCVHLTRDYRIRIELFFIFSRDRTKSYKR